MTIIDELVTKQADALKPDEPDPAMVAEGRRRVCLTTAIQMLMHNLLLPWEAVDYAKYLEDYLRDGTVPRDEMLETKMTPKRKAH